MYGRALSFIALLILVLGGLYVFVTEPATTGTETGEATSTVSGETASGSYSLQSVAAHAAATSCWSAINSKVYDLTSWINQHPGGSEAILSLCGKDGSSAFNTQHGGQSEPESRLEQFYIGTLTQ